MTDHVVKQGETLMALAAANGLTGWKDILDHASNAELKKKRPDPGVLKEGDKVFIPNREMKHDAAAVDAKHPYTVSRKKAWVRLALKEADGTALAGTFTLTVGKVSAAGTIAPGGILEQAVAIDADSGSLTVTTSDGRTESWELLLGYMDPIDEESGVLARLVNLGFASEEDEVAVAVKAFQERVGVEATGVIDDALRTKLTSYYDPAEAEKELDVIPEPAAEEEGQEAETT